MNVPLVILDDPYAEWGEPDLQFRLSYRGRLLAASKTDTRAFHKHEIRRLFHRQLCRLWDVLPQLKEARAMRLNGSIEVPARPRWAQLAQRFERCGVGFVPLVTEDLALYYGISVLFLRPDPPGKLIASGDLDNRLKTLFDALRIPNDLNEMGGKVDAESDKSPFFCLLEDDKLITRLAVETDTLLEPIRDPPDKNDCQLIITVSLERVMKNLLNGPFE